MTPPQNRHQQRSSHNVVATEEDAATAQRAKHKRMQSSMNMMMLPNIRQPSQRNVVGSSMFLT